jgi:hypothetical protein
MRLVVGNRSGIPCGWFYDFPAYYSQWVTEYPAWSGGTIIAPPTIARLNDLRSNGLSVIQNLAGFSNSFKTDGAFDIDKWKANVDAAYALGIESYIEDETIVGHYVIDEPTWPGSWGGVVVPSDVLDQLCAYSKAYWPTLPCVIRDEPTFLINHARERNTPWPDYDWQYLDAAWLQYKASKGTIPNYRAAQTAAAETLGVAVVPGLNWRDGGNGDSGLSWRSPANGWYVCTPEEVTEYSQGLMSNEVWDPSAFMMWRFQMTGKDPTAILDYMNSAPMRAAFDTLMDFCNSKQRRYLLRRPG